MLHTDVLGHASWLDKDFGLFDSKKQKTVP